MEKIEKTAVIKALKPNKEDLALINAQTLRPLTAEEVFTFKLAACDDQIDRDHERFTEETLKELAGLFVGRPVLTDHVWSAEKQVARVYAAQVEQADGRNRLVLRCYIPRRERTEETIAAIEAGLLRECSVGCVVKKALCSICGADKAKVCCEHRPGQEYGGQVCHVELSGAKDAYECSLVAVPAQKEAGVVKKYGGEDNPAAQTGPGEDPEVQKALALLELEQYA